MGTKRNWAFLGAIVVVCFGLSIVIGVMWNGYSLSADEYGVVLTNSQLTDKLYELEERVEKLEKLSDSNCIHSEVPDYENILLKEYIDYYKDTK